MTEVSEAAKVAEEILEELHPWIKEWDYHYLQGRISYVASVIQRLLDERDEYREQVEMMAAAGDEYKTKTDAQFKRLWQQLADILRQFERYARHRPDCRFCTPGDDWYPCTCGFTGVFKQLDEATSQKEPNDD